MRRRGIDLLTAQEADRCGLSDLDQLDWAHAQGRVLVTFDADFLALAASGHHHTGIAFCPASKYSVGDLIRGLILVYEGLEATDLEDQIEDL